MQMENYTTISSSISSFPHLACMKSAKVKIKTFEIKWILISMKIRI